MQGQAQPKGDWRAQLLWHVQDLGARLKDRIVDLFNKQYVEGFQQATTISDDLLGSEIEKLASRTAERSLTESERHLLDSLYRVRSELSKRVAEELASAATQSSDD